MTRNKKLYCDTIGCRMAYAVKGIIRDLSRRFEEKGINLTVEQFFVLNILEKEDGLILQDLAEIIDRDKSAVFRHIEGLEEHQFVGRAKDPDDRRRKILLVTKAGMEELKKARIIDQSIDKEITEDLDGSDLDKVEDFISGIIEITNPLQYR